MEKTRFLGGISSSLQVIPGNIFRSVLPCSKVLGLIKLAWVPVLEGSVRPLGFVTFTLIIRGMILHDLGWRQITQKDHWLWMEGSLGRNRCDAFLTEPSACPRPIQYVWVPLEASNNRPKLDTKQPRLETSHTSITNPR